MRYPNRLKELRITKGLTQKEVAAFMGKQCEDRLSEWERGKNMPSVLNLLKLSGIYKVPIQEIYPNFQLEMETKIEKPGLLDITSVARLGLEPR